MAKSRKQQRAAKGAIAKAAEAVKETVVDAAKATTRVAENYVVEPVKNVLGFGSKKPPKKRHVRPAKPTSAAEPAPLARGKSHAAKTMSAGIGKGLGALTTTDTAGSAMTRNRSQSSASAGSESSARSSRRRARRRSGES